MNHSLKKTTYGTIETICGCMYSGKTEELLRQLKRCEYAKQSYQVFKPTIDSRYSETEVSTHNLQKIPSTVIDSPEEIYQHLKHDTQVVGIDEAQFFAPGIVEVVSKLANHGRRVLVAGLDTDWQGQPFGPMPNLLAISDIIRKQYAVCMVCGDSATKTQRLVNNSDEILVGSFNMYEARCRDHFDPKLSLNKAKSPQQELSL